MEKEIECISIRSTRPTGRVIPMFACCIRLHSSAGRQNEMHPCRYAPHILSLFLSPTEFSPSESILSRLLERALHLSPAIVKFSRRNLRGFAFGTNRVSEKCNLQRVTQTKEFAFVLRTVERFISREP